MSFYLYFLCGFVGGVLGGMGMGGGTLYIPLVTLLLGVDQKIAQGINLLSFLPMALVALPKHFQNKLVQTKGIWSMILPAVACSTLGSFLGTALPSVLLRKLFGVFLLILAFFQFTNRGK